MEARVIDLLTSDGAIEAIGAIVLYLLLFFSLAAAVLLPLFTFLAIRYAFRLIRRKLTS
jgi:hypothetical protein